MFYCFILFNLTIPNRAKTYFIYTGYLLYYYFHHYPLDPGRNKECIRFTMTFVNSKCWKKVQFIKNNAFQNGFPILTSIIPIFLTNPPTTASCEKLFSYLKKLNKFLRTIIGQERVSYLATLQIEKY